MRPRPNTVSGIPTRLWGSTAGEPHCRCGDIGLPEPRLSAGSYITVVIKIYFTFLGESPFFCTLSITSCNTQLRGTLGVFTASPSAARSSCGMNIQPALGDTNQPLRHPSCTLWCPCMLAVGSACCVQPVLQICCKQPQHTQRRVCFCCTAPWGAGSSAAVLTRCSLQTKQCALVLGASLLAKLGWKGRKKKKKRKSVQPNPQVASCSLLCQLSATPCPGSGL